MDDFAISNSEAQSVDGDVGQSRKSFFRRAATIRFELDDKSHVELRGLSRGSLPALAALLEEDMASLEFARRVVALQAIDGDALPAHMSVEELRRAVIAIAKSIDEKSIEQAPDAYDAFREICRAKVDEAIEPIQNLLEWVQYDSRRFAAQFSEAIEGIADGSAGTSLLAQLPSWTDRLGQLSTKIKDIEEETGDISFGYSSDFWDVRFFLSVDEIAEGDREAQIRQHAIDVSQKPMLLDELRQLFKQNIKLAPRYNAVASGLEDHESGRYYSSIPVLMAQIEGVLGDILLETKLATWDGVNYYNSSTSQRLSGLADKKDLAKSSSRIPQDKKYLWDHIHTPQKAQNNDGFSRSRNAVLHGSNVTYGTAETAAHVVLTLASLALTLDEIVRASTSSTS